MKHLGQRLAEERVSKARKARQARFEAAERWSETPEGRAEIAHIDAYWRAEAAAGRGPLTKPPFRTR